MALVITIILIIVIVKYIRKKKYKELETAVLSELGFYNWTFIPYYDAYVTVKSRQAFEKYHNVKFFKDNKDMLTKAENIIRQKNEVANKLRLFLENNGYESHSQYKRLIKQINAVLKNTGVSGAFRIKVSYISSAGNQLDTKEITVGQYTIDRFKKDPSLLMGKGEYNKYIKEQQKAVLNQKQHEYYERVNRIIDYANANRDALVIKDSQKQLDSLMGQLFDRTVNSIKKSKRRTAKNGH